MEFVLDGLGLLGSFDGVELSAKAGDFLAVLGDVALKARAERVFMGERGGGFGGEAFGGGERGLGLCDLGRQGAQLLMDANAVEFD